MLLLEKLPNIHLTFRMGESEVLWPLSTWQGFELYLSRSVPCPTFFTTSWTTVDYCGLSSLVGPSHPAPASSTMIEEYDVSSGLSNSKSVEVQLDNQFQKTFEKNRFQLDLRTIRESPETVYTVSYMETTSTAAGELDEGAVLVPPVEPAVPGVSIVELSGSESGEEDLDLRRLNERADKLSKELKELNSQALKDNENDDNSVSDINDKESDEEEDDESSIEEDSENGQQNDSVEPSAVKQSQNH